MRDTRLMQVLYCGFAAVGSEMKPYYKWGLYADPIFFVMNALFVIEFKGNEDTIASFTAATEGADFDDLSKLYGWTFSLQASLLLIVVHCIGYKVLNFIALTYLNFSKS